MRNSIKLNKPVQKLCTNAFRVKHEKNIATKTALVKRRDPNNRTLSITSIKHFPNSIHPLANVSIKRQTRLRPLLIHLIREP